MLKKEPEDGQVHGWGREVMQQCMGSRFAPLPPPAFEEMMVAGMAREEAEAGTGFRFTNGKDATSVCIPQYRAAFLRLLSGAEKLVYGGCGWGDEDAAVACDALLWAHANGATSPATFLTLHDNKLTDACVPRLVEVLSAGAAPKLKSLYLIAGNALSDAGKQSVKAARKKRRVAMIV